MRFERTVLGLSLAFGTIAAGSLSAPALAAIDPTDAMSLCSRMSTNEARLECYDTVAKDIAEGRIQRAPAPQATTPVAPAPAQSWAPPPPPSSVTASGPSWAAPPAPAQAGAGSGSAAVGSGFGSESIKRGPGDRRPADGPNEVQAEVVSATDNGLQQWRITLSDGAIWQMTERASLFRPPAPHEIVTIRKGALGGFMMDVGKQASIRVMRIK